MLKHSIRRAYIRDDPCSQHPGRLARYVGIPPQLVRLVKRNDYLC